MRSCLANCDVRCKHYAHPIRMAQPDAIENDNSTRFRGLDLRGRLTAVWESEHSTLRRTFEDGELRTGWCQYDAIGTGHSTRPRAVD